MKRKYYKIYTNYISGPVAKTITSGKMKDLLIMNTHGGRPYLIESGQLVIDVAFSYPVLIMRVMVMVLKEIMLVVL